MEIIHLILGKANPERMNGVNKVVYQLATEQAAFGEQVSVWGITADKDVNFGKRNFETRLFSKQSNPFSYAKELKSAIIRKAGKAVFHLHGGWIPVYYSLSKLFRAYNISFVLTPHGAYNTIAMQKSSNLKKFYFRFFESYLLSRASQIHCIGNSEVNGLHSIFENNKSVLLPYGFRKCELVKIKPKANGEIVFGFVGRLDIYTKGLDTLLLAFKKFNTKYPDSQLWIVGEGKQKPLLLEQIVQNSLTGKVILFGSKYGAEKEKVLRTIDVFVHPSRNEGLPVSVIEAASFGKPCLVTEATNLGQLIEQFNAGNTIYQQCSESLYLAMDRLHQIWEKPLDFKRMQKNAVQMVQESFDWEKLLLRFRLDLYHF